MYGGVSELSPWKKLCRRFYAPNLFRLGIRCPRALKCGFEYATIIYLPLRRRTYRRNDDMRFDMKRWFSLRNDKWQSFRKRYRQSLRYDGFPKSVRLENGRNAPQNQGITMPISRLRRVPAVRNSFQENTNLSDEINCRQSATYRFRIDLYSICIPFVSKWPDKNNFLFNRLPQSDLQAAGAEFYFLEK